MLSLYIHYPFCKSKCPYCDFNSHVNPEVDYERFARAYDRELEFFAQKTLEREVKTIFFGGGTPSLMPISLAERILTKVRALWKIADDVEITLEANPTSAESKKFEALKSLGINRVSIGIQALNDTDLKFLGREHSAKEAIEVVHTAAKIFPNFSIDLIYARPGQTLESWKRELEIACELSPNHLSLYQLTIEKGTKFFSSYNEGKFVLPDEETAAKLYELTEEITAKFGFGGYEISNYAQPNFECRHNLAYWQGQDYVGVGPGAHSRVYFGSERMSAMVTNDPLNWLNKVESVGNGIQQLAQLTKNEVAEELILTGLRTTKGIGDKIFLSHFGKKMSAVLDFQKLKNLKDFIELGSDEEGERLRVTSKLLTNQIVSKVCDAIIPT